MRLGNLQEAWEQYRLWFGEIAPPSPSEGVFVFEGDTLLAGCCIESSARTMIVSGADYRRLDAGKFMIGVLRGHAKVTGREVIMYLAAEKADELSLDSMVVYTPGEEEAPQASKKSADPEETPHTEPTDQGGTEEDVPPEVVESKPRARRKRGKK